MFEFWFMLHNSYINEALLIAMKHSSVLIQTLLNLDGVMLFVEPRVFYFLDWLFWFSFFCLFSVRKFSYIASFSSSFSTLFYLYLLRIEIELSKCHLTLNCKIIQKKKMRTLNFSYSSPLGLIRTIAQEVYWYLLIH
jgi:hypothetical protein